MTRKSYARGKEHPRHGRRPGDDVRHSEPSEVWSIEKVVPGGEGLARLESGEIGFAPGTLPGERARVVRSSAGRGYRRALRLEILEPAPGRVEPPCPLASVCGGCDLLHADYPTQLRIKQQILKEALERTGRLSAPAELGIEPAPRPLGYRNRLRVHLGQDGSIGFHARGSHRIIDVRHCAVADPALATLLDTFRDVARAEPELAAWFEEAELRIAPEPPRELVRLARRRGARADASASERVLARVRTRFAVSVVGAPDALAQRFRHPDGGALLVPPGAFVQVNWAVNTRIVAALVQGARDRAVASFLDLYAGAGNLGLALLRAGLSGTLVESVAVAADAARQVVREEGLTGAEILAVDALEAVERFVREARRFELIVLDPPRAGAAELVGRVAELEPRAIAYVSCDPVTLARDLRRLVDRGFVLEGIRGYDMFPGTHHFETLAWLRRGEVPAR